MIEEKFWMIMSKHICKLNITKLWFVYDVDFDFILKFSNIISKIAKDIIFQNRIK
jgi:hypothetical protein